MKNKYNKHSKLVELMMPVPCLYFFPTHWLNTINCEWVTATCLNTRSILFPHSRKDRNKWVLKSWREPSTNDRRGADGYVPQLPHFIVGGNWALVVCRDNVLNNLCLPDLLPHSHTCFSWGYLPNKLLSLKFCLSISF